MKASKTPGKIAVSISSSDFIPVDFFLTLAQCMLNSRHKIASVMNNAVGERHTINRNTLVEMARDCKASHILFLDSNILFPPDLFLTLLNHKKDIVCATYSPCVEGDRSAIAIPVGEDNQVDADSLTEVQYVPLGCMLVRMEVFDKLQKPYFAEPIDTANQAPIGDDFYFCNMARQAGFKIWCDFDLSLKIGHIGKKVYFIKT